MTCDPTRDRIEIEPSAVAKVLEALHTKRASGPDGILHITFANELTQAWSPLFQLSVDTHTIRTVWMQAVIISVTEKTLPIGK